jgi:MFS transporter, FHS family, glucose/mannose:H+ symporter
LEVLTVYAAGLFQGLSLVAVPAAATILTSPTGYDLSKSRYGLLFLPQVVLAIAGSLALPTLARRVGLKRVLLAGIVADLVAMSLLVASDAVQHDAVAFPMLLVATASLGLGFGLTLGSISTYAGAFMPDRRDVALTSLNVLLGLGTALSPFLVALFTSIGQWWYLPLLAAAGLAVLFVLAILQPMDVPITGARRERGTGVPSLFWIFAGALVIYGIGETMFGNWGTTLLAGHGVKATSAQDALAVFWAAVTVGRLGIALVSNHIRTTRIYVVLPWAMALFGLLPHDRRLRRGDLSQPRRIGGRVAHRGLSGGLRPGRLRWRPVAERHLAEHHLPVGRVAGRRHGLCGHAHRPPPARGERTPPEPDLDALTDP